MPLAQTAVSRSWETGSLLYWAPYIGTPRSLFGRSSWCPMSDASPAGCCPSGPSPPSAAPALLARPGGCCLAARLLPADPLSPALPVQLLRGAPSGGPLLRLLGAAGPPYPRGSSATAPCCATRRRRRPEGNPVPRGDRPWRPAQPTALLSAFRAAYLHRFSAYLHTTVSVLSRGVSLDNQPKC